MPITVTAFKWVPPFAQGNVRDHRIHWMLNEVGWRYECRLLDLRVARRPGAAKEVCRRLQQLSAALDDRVYLVGDSFSIADLMIASVLR